MSTNRSTFFVAAGACLFGAMIPLLLGASQAPEKQFPRYSVSGGGEHYLLVVDNQKDELHVYRSLHSGDNAKLYKTIDLTQAGEKKLTHKYYFGDEEPRANIQLPNKTPK